MRVLQRGTPMALPANCVQCGYGNTDRVYIDFELDIEFFGSVYVCETCFNSWIDGWVTPASHAKDMELKSLKTQVEELTRERNSLLDTIRAFRIPEPESSGKLNFSSAESTEEPKRPRRYPDDFNKSSSEPRPDDVLSFASE